MKYTLFVQSGNRKQTESNGMRGNEYSIGASNGLNRNFVILIGNKISSPNWSINKEFATTFRLELILEKKPQTSFTAEDIPF